MVCRLGLDVIITDHHAVGSALPPAVAVVDPHREDDPYLFKHLSAVGLLWGIELPIVVKGLETVTWLPGRMERIECGQPFATYVDVSSTPDSLSGALRDAASSWRSRLH